MGRWTHVPTSGPKRQDIEREATAEILRGVAEVGGTLLPEDQSRVTGQTILRLVAGRTEMQALAPDTLGQSAAYEFAKQLMAQDFVVTTSDGTKVTLPSSGQHFAEKLRYKIARDMQLASCKKPPRPGKRKRGRPNK